MICLYFDFDFDFDLCIILSLVEKGGRRGDVKRVGPRTSEETMRLTRGERYGWKSKKRNGVDLGAT